MWSLFVVALWLAPACHPDPRGETEGALPTTITATEYGFSGPDTVPSGLVTLRLVNAGREPHQAGLVRIEGARTPTEIAAGFESSAPPPWMAFVGGPDAVNPGDTASATQRLAPGTYVLVCFLPSADGTMHLDKGMIRNLVVREEASPDPPSTLAGDDTLTLGDYTFTLAHPLRAGTHTIYVENSGPQLHEVMVLSLAPGKSVRHVVAWNSHWMPGPLPARPLGGVVTLDAGTHAAFTVTLERGSYVLACFIPDRKDGKAHVLHGMVNEITVK
jgi:uncharacterized cupredoxin-like copper-binding protein